MPGRPRTISDQQLLSAVAITVSKIGVTQLTLADIAREAGVSTGALMQRFGSKRNVLLAFAGQGGNAERMQAAYRDADDPLTGLRQAFLIFATTPGSTRAFAHHLGFLALDLADPDFHALLVKHETDVRAEFQTYLTEAADRGLLSHKDIAPLVDAIAALRHGSQISWAIQQKGSLRQAMLRDLNTLLASHLINQPEPTTGRAQ